MQTSTSGFASASFCRIMAIRSLTLAAPGGCCGCLNMRGMKGLWVMPMIDTIWAMGHLLRLVVSCLARWLELCKRPSGFGIKTQRPLSSKKYILNLCELGALARVIGFLILRRVENDLPGDLVVFNDAVGFRRVA